jgi:LmbE family N-acetylglucosaminyl deacetylase
LDDVQLVINEEKPEQVYIPYASYNQDHQTVFKASYAALRPHDRNFFVKKVLVYEQVHPFLWDYTGFKPAYFRWLDVNQKLTGYNYHCSQVREHRNEEKIKVLAKLRGYQSNMDYAEGFEVVRWID